MDKTENPTNADMIFEYLKISKLYEDFKFAKLDESAAKNRAQFIRL